MPPPISLLYDSIPTFNTPRSGAREYLATSQKSPPGTLETLTKNRTRTRARRYSSAAQILLARPLPRHERQSTSLVRVRSHERGTTLPTPPEGRRIIYRRHLLLVVVRMAGAFSAKKQ